MPQNAALGLAKVLTQKVPYILKSSKWKLSSTVTKRRQCRTVMTSLEIFKWLWLQHAAIVLGGCLDVCLVDESSLGFLL